MREVQSDYLDCVEDFAIENLLTFFQSEKKIKIGDHFFFSVGNKIGALNEKISSRREIFMK